MNSVFTAKLLQNLRNKKGNKGFTLIELLVVVIIIGVLAAVALPNLLGQVGKARESEAKSTLGALNRAQQAYFTEKAEFATTMALLEIPTGNEKYYTTIAVDPNTAGVQYAHNPSNATDGTRDFVAGVSYNPVDRRFGTAICRAGNSFGDPDFDMSADPDSYFSNPGLLPSTATAGDAIACVPASVASGALEEVE